MATLHSLSLLFSATTHLYIVGGGGGWVILELRNMVSCSMNLLLIPNLTLPVKNMHREQLVFGKMIRRIKPGYGLNSVPVPISGVMYVPGTVYRNFYCLFIRFFTVFVVVQK
jgi:hypothetical protein